MRIAFYPSTLAAIRTKVRVPRGSASTDLDFTELFHKSTQIVALPQTAQALVNCRILPGHSPEEVRNQLIRMLADPKVTVRYMDGSSGEVSDRAPDKTGPLPGAPRADALQPLEKIADSLWPGAPVVVDMETGASDSKYTNAAGMPSLGIGEEAIDHDDIRSHRQPLLGRLAGQQRDDAHGESRDDLEGEAVPGGVTLFIGFPQPGNKQGRRNVS